MSMAKSERYDVVVVGGGSAGVAAAAGAAQSGARTLLVESYGFLGGAATHSIVLAWCGFYPQRPGPFPDRLVGGVATQVLDQLTGLGISVEPYYSPTGNWNIRLNPEATKIALDRTVEAAGVEVALHTMVTGATSAGGRIESLRINDHRGIREIGAGAFVDASGDSDLAFLAGATPCSLHPVNHGRQPASFPVRIAGVAPGQTLDKAARAGAMARIERRLGRAELRRDGGTMTILPGTDDVWWLAVEAETNGLDGADLGEAERDGRALVWRGVEALRNHVPGFERANVSGTGPNIGIRETRHAATIGPLHEADLVEGRRRRDGVARGGWPMEIHRGPGKVEYRPIGGDGTYDIPLDALRSSDFRNLWFGGRTIGADAAAYASARVMGTAFATGHAAGVAAAMPNENIGAIRAELARQGALI
jgi:hypothetical protein